MSKSKGNVVDPLEVMEHVRHRRASASRWPPSPPRAGTSGSPRSASRATATSPTSSGTPRASCSRTSTGYRPRARAEGAGPPGRALDQEPPRADRRRRPEGARRLPLQRRGRAPSTSSSGTSSATGTSRSPSGRLYQADDPAARARTQRDARRGPRDDAPPAPSLHALHHRGDLAAVPEGQGGAGQHHDRPLPAGPSPRSRPGRRGGHGADHGGRERRAKPQERAPDPSLADADGHRPAARRNRGGEPPGDGGRGRRRSPAPRSRSIPRRPVHRTPLLAIADGCEVYVPMEGVVDVEAERGRLSRELRRVEEDLGRHRGQARAGGLPPARSRGGRRPRRSERGGAARAPGEAP